MNMEMFNLPNLEFQQFSYPFFVEWSLVGCMECMSMHTHTWRIFIVLMVILQQMGKIISDKVYFLHVVNISLWSHDIFYKYF